MSGAPQAARTWVEHLRHGGSTPWLEWLRTGPAAPDAGPTDPLPGAAQAEVVRRLAARRTEGGPAFTLLADRVLSRSGPGRGLAQLPLLVPGEPLPSRVGAPPTDPARVPVEELVRVGVGALADLLLTAPAAPTRVRQRRRWPWSRQFKVVGAPVTAADVRAALAAAGHVEGGRQPDVVLLAQPFDVHLGQVWTARVQRGAPVRWDTFVGRWARRDQLPPALRLDAVARRWAGLVGAEKVHVVVAPRDGSAARRTAAAAVGLRAAEGPVQGGLRDLSPAGTDVLRRLNRVLGVRLAASGHRAVLERAAALVDRGPGTPLAVPPEHRAWADERAGRLVEGLRAGGYAVHGDLHEVAVRHRDGDVRPHGQDVLGLVLDACLELAVDGRTGQEAQ